MKAIDVRDCHRENWDILESSTIQNLTFKEMLIRLDWKDDNFTEENIYIKSKINFKSL